MEPDHAHITSLLSASSPMDWPATGAALACCLRPSLVIKEISQVGLGVAQADGVPQQLITLSPRQ